MNILIVEDDSLMAESIKNVFKKTTSVTYVDIADSFRSGLDKCLSSAFDVVLVDIFLEGYQPRGLDLCKIIRRNNKNIPIIVISSADSLEYLEEAFEIGVNDYITKPFNRKELELRVKRWFFSKSVTLSKPKKLHYHELSYDQSKNQFYFGEIPLNLTKKNKKLLLLFLLEPERLLGKFYLQEKLWGDYDPGSKSRNIRSNIQFLRNSLKGCCDIWIETIKGEGYILIKRGI